MDSNRLRNSAAYLTWAVVSLCALYVHFHAGGLQRLFWVSLALQLTGGIGILLTIETRSPATLPLRYLGLVLQALAAIALSFTMHQGFLTIYTIVLVAQLPYFIGLRPGLLCTALIMASYYCTWRFYWQAPSAVIDTLLWSTFHLFSLVVNYGLNRERQQKDQAIAINQELKGAQSLLQEAAKQGERLRIARDLHDRLGHQLTALSIQLDVLRRSCPPPQQQQAESSYQLAQELLQSIRSAVTDLRDHHGVDIRSALAGIAEGLPGLEVELDWPTDVQLDSLQQAEALFYCVQEACTNTLKHAGATHLGIRARAENGQLRVAVEDNGDAPATLVPGNGFTGMAERMAAINGHFNWQRAERGLLIQLDAPLASTP